MNVNLTGRPSALPAVWAQVSGVCIRSASGVARDLLVGHPSVRAMAAGAPQLPQVHQVSRPAVLAQPMKPVGIGSSQRVTARAQRVQMAANYGTNGTTGFRGIDIATAKQLADGVSGAPPRGRPV